MKVKQNTLYSGKENDLIEFFEEKYPLKQNGSSARIPGEFYYYDPDNQKSFRAQIEALKVNVLSLVFFTSVANNDDGTQTIHINAEYVRKVE
jgi:hypothetical protein